MDLASRIARSLIGCPVRLPDGLVAAYPELAALRVRRGGLPPRVGGWALGRTTVEAITLRRTIFLAPHAPLEAGLLLHELRHAEQFFESRAFPLRYLWESVRHGYESNRFERDARRYATHRLGGAASGNSSGRV